MTPLTEFLTHSYALALLVALPLTASFILMVMPRTWGFTIRLIAAAATGITLLISLLMVWDYWTLVRDGVIAVSGPVDFANIWRYGNSDCRICSTSAPSRCIWQPTGRGWRCAC